MTITAAAPTTRDRLVVAALGQIASRGYEATSLDEVAAEAGVRKQTLLYHHPSKEQLLAAVIHHGIDELSSVLRAARDQADTAGRDPVIAMVDTVLRLGTARPELLDLVREVLRLGPPAATTLRREAEPLMRELADVVPRPTVVGAVAIVVGMATEVEVARGLGMEPTVGDLRRRRRVLLDHLTGSR